MTARTDQAHFGATLAAMFALQLSNLGFPPLLPAIQRDFGMSRIGEADQVFDQRFQFSGRTPHDLDGGLLFRGERAEIGFRQHLGIAFDVRQRGAQLVGDIGDEIGFEARQFRKALQGLLQGAGAGVHPRFELEIGFPQGILQLEDLLGDCPVEGGLVDHSQFRQGVTRKPFNTSPA